MQNNALMKDFFVTIFLSLEKTSMIVTWNAGEKTRAACVHEMIFLWSIHVSCCYVELLLGLKSF